MNHPNVKIELTPRARRFLEELAGTPLPADLMHGCRRQDVQRLRAVKSPGIAVAVPLLVIAFVGVLWLLGVQVGP